LALCKSFLLNYLYVHQVSLAMSPASRIRSNSSSRRHFGTVCCLVRL